MTSTVATTSTIADPGIVERARGRAAEVVVLPLREGRNGGVYSVGTLMLVKALREAGVNAAFLHDPESRTFEVKESAAVDLVLIPLAVGMLSSASWDLVKALLLRGGSRKLEVRYTSLENKGTHATTWTATGDPKAVLDAIDRLRETRKP